MDILNMKYLLTRFDRQVWTLFGGEMVNVFGTSLVMTFLSIYMYEHMGMTMTEVGIAVFLSSILGAAAAYLGGSLCDSYGRKKMLIIGLVLQIVAYIVLSLAMDSGVEYLLFVCALSFSNIIGGLYRSVPEVMVADVVKQEDRVEAYGLLRIGANLGWVVGPVLGGFCLLFLSYPLMFYITALTTFIYLLIALFLLRDTMPSGQKDRLKLRDIVQVASDKPFLLFCLINLLMTIPYQQMYTLFSVYSSAYVHLNEFWIGVLFAESGFLVVLFQFFISMKVKDHKMTAALACAAVVFAAGFGMLSLSTFVILPFIGIGIMTLGEMIWSPANSTMQANMSPESHRGRYFGFAALFSSVGFAVGPLFGGVLKDSMNNNVPAMWIVVSGMFVVCAAGFLMLGRFIPAKANNDKKEKPQKKMEAPIEA
jgi:MFS family permease